MLAISTAWNYKDDMNVRAALDEIKRAGVDTLELGYRLRHDQLEEAVKLLPSLGMNVCSVHNFCPVPNDKPSPRHVSNYYRVSAQDEEERQASVRWTKACIDTAVRVKAQVVVIHAGQVDPVFDDSFKLIELYKLGHGATSEFAERREQLVRDREKHKAPYLDAVKKSIREILVYAQSKSILIGLETRYYPMEIPNFHEVGELLGLFNKQGLFYWHDTGHGEVNSRLGLTPHQDFLKAYKDRLIGFHVHGVRVLRDHQAPFVGDFDMEWILPYMKGTINVIESHHYASFDQMKTAVKKLRDRVY